MCLICKLQVRRPNQAKAVCAGRAASTLAAGIRDVQSAVFGCTPALRPSARESVRHAFPARFPALLSPAGRDCPPYRRRLGNREVFAWPIPVRACGANRGARRKEERRLPEGGSPSTANAQKRVPPLGDRTGRVALPRDLVIGKTPLKPQKN